jgi:hypothetical protein
MDENILAFLLILLGVLVFCFGMSSKETMNRFLISGALAKIIFIPLLLLVAISEILIHTLKISALPYYVYFTCIVGFYLGKYLHSKFYINSKVFSVSEKFYRKFSNGEIWLLLLSLDNLFSAGILLSKKM